MLRDRLAQTGGTLNFDRIRAIARGERPGIITAREAAVLAAALDVPLDRVEAAATVVRPA